MDDIDYHLVKKLLDEKVRPSSKARLDEDGKLLPELANSGGKKGTIVKLERQGEYYGIAVELLGDVRPILTDHMMKRIVRMIERQDYGSPLEILRLSKVEQLHYLLYKWFQVSITEMNPISKPKKDYPKLDSWITAVRHDPIDAPIRVVEFGFNRDTKSSVLPEDWIDREFESAFELHKAFDRLPSRAGKPPVTYAVIYAMHIQSATTLIENPKTADYDHIYYLILNADPPSLHVKRVRRVKKDFHYVQYDRVLIGFVLEEILEAKKSEGARQVGVMVSRLQKAIRRGREGSKILMETLETLNTCPNYNLPEHNFLRVSASKQLAWRLFITILEDCRPYSPEKCTGLLPLLLLVLISQRLTEYRFTRPVLDLLKDLALFAQYNDTPEDSSYWRELEIASETPIDPESEYRTALSLALSNLPMMSGDREMLSRLYSDQRDHPPFEIPPRYWSLRKEIMVNGYDHNPKVYRDIELATFDNHCKAWIILYYQAVRGQAMTTEQIASHIWDISSSYNVRSSEKPETDKQLRSIQRYLSEDETEASNYFEMERPSLDRIPVTENALRTAFLVMFGTKWSFRGYDLVFSGTPEFPLRIKKKSGGEWEYSQDSEMINSFPKRTVDLARYDPPSGFQWKLPYVNVNTERGKPFVDGSSCEFYSCNRVLRPIVPQGVRLVDGHLMMTILLVMSGAEIDFKHLIRLRRKQVERIYDWVPRRKIVEIFDKELVRLAYTKIFNQINNIIMIGPVMRTGQKMQNSINYYLEGKLWGVFCLFRHLYPETFKISGPLNFQVRKNTLGYTHLVQQLEKILFYPRTFTPKYRPPKVITPLWDHQKDSRDKIIGGFRTGAYGRGDASHVGSGKTLTGLSVAASLISIGDPVYSGILVLLPNNKLIPTWEEEIRRHTRGFDVVFQETRSSGIDYDIRPETIFVTTLGRMRDSPLTHRWLLVIIDECLAVQNKNALWTESAWVQSKMSKHLLMMSATFFRSRFDKLYYMLKMLGTGLPESKEYLDTILLESIVSQMPLTNRVWHTNINRFNLASKLRKEYQTIENSEQSLEKKYASLNSFLVDERVVENVGASLAGLIEEKESEGRRCLIYARSMDEASIWSERLGIPIYPKKGDHCIVTYHEGTYGLNDLVIYDCLVMRPPPPDKLPQIKGRLDRPGQESNELFIEYFVLSQTIEEGLLIRMSIASEFMHKYIMPLAQFYEVSVNYRSYLTE